MAKTLANARDREEIERRFVALTSDSMRRWGSMSVGGMLCHVDDSYQVVMGERPFSCTKLAIPGGMAKFFALRSPMRWPRNLKTGDSVRQGGAERRRWSLRGTARVCLRRWPAFTRARR